MFTIIKYISITKPNNLVTVAGADTFLTTGPDSSGYQRIGATTVSKLNSTNQETVLNYLIEKTRDEYSLVSVLFVFLMLTHYNTLFPLG